MAASPRSAAWSRRCAGQEFTDERETVMREIGRVRAAADRLEGALDDGEFTLDEQWVQLLCSRAMVTSVFSSGGWMRKGRAPHGYVRLPGDVRPMESGEGPSAVTHFRVTAGLGRGWRVPAVEGQGPWRIPVGDLAGRQLGVFAP
ncbi:DUF6192 family protein [Streptomyces canus]|uniref:DUF6192 family protein n=1 Tax=Streptomyces canus TaxID=58343 RepID=UPI0036C88917